MSADQAPSLVHQARRFAALSGTFDPVDLLGSLGDLDDQDARQVTVDLASVCDTTSDSSWIMRGSVRRTEIAGLVKDDALHPALAWRRDLAPDAETGDLLDALAGAGSFAPSAVTAVLHGPASPQEELTRLVTTLDRAGPPAAAHGHLEALRAALGRRDARSRPGATLEGGFFGREDEMASAERVLREPSQRPPVTAVYVSGLPGIGKSTFVDALTSRATHQSPPWILVRLDFDRGGLDVQDLLGLTLEVSRQVARELGPIASELNAARLTAAGAGSTTQPVTKGMGRDRVPDQLSGVLGQVVRRGGRPVLLVLDTLEVLRRRGETHPVRLFEAIDELCERGLSPLGVVAAGRGWALDGVPERVAGWIELPGLHGAGADRLLSRLEVEPDLFPRIKDLAGGVPLVLRLCSLAVREGGALAVEAAAGLGEHADSDLYRFLGSRISDPALRSLAQPGLIVRRLNAELIADVLAPEVGLSGMGTADAADALQDLAAQHWLVEPDDVVPGWVQHRPAVRRVLLRGLYEAEGARAARLDRAAARWFEGRPEPFAQVEAAYHHLQAMRSGRPAPVLAPPVLHQLDDETLAELPEVARDVVLIARGERTSQFRGDGPLRGSVDLSGAARELAPVLERGDLREAEYLYDRSFAQVDVDPTSPEAAVARSFLWRAGRWATALRTFEPHRSFAGSLRDGSPTISLAHLEMWAESRFAQLVDVLRARPELLDLAAELRHGELTGSLADGALGFALARAGTDLAQPRARWSTTDPVASAVTLWATPTRWGSADPDQQVLDALAVPSGGLAASVSGPAGRVGALPTPVLLPDLGTPVGAARVQASATPYASVADALLSLDRCGPLRALATEIQHRIAVARGLPPAGAGGWRVAPATTPEGAMVSLTRTGLLAEWLGATAFLLDDPDLRRVAWSAERWRRTSAGDWAYQADPGVPTWSTRPDATLRDRVARLASRGDCLEHLATWAALDGPAEAASLAERLRRRYPAASREAQRRPPESAAATLVEHRMPAAFIPPLARLSALEGERP